MLFSLKEIVTSALENSPSEGKEEFGDKVLNFTGRFQNTHSLISVWIECSDRDVLFLER